MGASYCRKSRTHGGVGIFVYNTLLYSTVNLNKVCNDYAFEACVIKLLISSNIYFILCIYRPPVGNFTTFLLHLQSILTQIYSNTTNLIICGDFNVDYLHDSRNKNLLNSLLASFNLHSAVNFPTRISNSSSTIIDNIFIDKMKNKYHTTIPISNGLSDHDGQLIQLHDINIPIQQTNSISKRIINEATIVQFKTNLSYESWFNVFNNEDVDSSYNFLSTYLRIYLNSFPSKKVYINNNNNKVWLTKGIRISCQRKRDFYLICKHTTNLRFRIYYKTYCKILTQVIKAAKRPHFNYLMKHSLNKTKTMWKLVKTEINRQESTDKFPPYIEGSLVKDHYELANLFNNYFINVTTNTNVNKSTNNHIVIDNLHSVYKDTFPQI